MKPVSYHLPTLLTMKYCKNWIQHYTTGLLTLHATFPVMQEVHSPVKSILNRPDQFTSEFQYISGAHLLFHPYFNRCNDRTNVIITVPHDFVHGFEHVTDGT